MNQRQKLKKLKKDNELMHKIINNYPEMKQLYDAYNSPLNVTYTTMPFQEFKSKRHIPFGLSTDWAIEACKCELKDEIVNFIKPMIQVIQHDDVMEASIFIWENRNEISN